MCATPSARASSRSTRRSRFSNASGDPESHDAQRDAVNLWNGNKARAVEIVAEITKLPPAVVEYAHGQTVQMLYGLSDEQIDTLVLQLKLIKETGFLKSDVWDNPDRIKKEFFWRPA